MYEGNIQGSLYSSDICSSSESYNTYFSDLTVAYRDKSDTYQAMATPHPDLVDSSSGAVPYVGKNWSFGTVTYLNSLKI